MKKPDAIVPNELLDPDWLDAVVREHVPGLYARQRREVIECVLDCLDVRESSSGLKLWRQGRR